MVNLPQPIEGSDEAAAIGSGREKIPTPIESHGRARDEAAAIVGVKLPAGPYVADDAPDSGTSYPRHQVVNLSTCTSWS